MLLAMPDLIKTDTKSYSYNDDLHGAILHSQQRINQLSSKYVTHNGDDPC